MALADSLIFSDLIATIILLITVAIMIFILSGILIQLSINDYYASISAYIFHECLSGEIEPINYTHVRIVRGALDHGYLLICPLITYNPSSNELNVTIYTALPG